LERFNSRARLSSHLEISGGTFKVRVCMEKK
jgi:hypothetical protein